MWACVWRSEDNLGESVLSFHHVGSGDQIQAWWQAPLLIEAPRQHRMIFLNMASSECGDMAVVSLHKETKRSTVTLILCFLRESRLI